MSNSYDLIIIGGGPAGLAAACKARQMGLDRMVVVERENFLGGILPQCIHAGFGLNIFKKELTGPEYAQLFIDQVKNLDIEVRLDTMALSINRAKEVIIASKKAGFSTIRGKAIILASGCRERTRGALSIAGSRPAGVYTAGVAQRMINLYGCLPGKKAVILGSGDIGLIMARRLIWEGCQVEGVYELMPYSSGLNRNIVQCLEDYDIPLAFHSTVSRIIGGGRLQAVEITNTVSGAAKIVKCDTLLLSVGLIPENELAREAGIGMDPATGGPVVDQFFSTSAEGIFSCGNSLFVYDLVDQVTRDAYLAGKAAVNYIRGKRHARPEIEVAAGRGISQLIPEKITGTDGVEFKIRVKQPFVQARLSIKGTRLKRIQKYLNPGEMALWRVRREDFSKYEISKHQKIVVEAEGYEN